ncbi:hypothetical protein TD95_002673 [Thielaviopsis punctulata]|uniref:G-patch domain-containing protein n=1 Tax=Thielaviopsis punctulata TaxID=72032 RepID=A0A0F4ZKE9_9PEZI|nr:hypothetical protein TD95_002673 [Thielaviopsis punctulata]
MASKPRPLRAEPPARPTPKSPHPTTDDDNDDDDYMTMSIADPLPARETSIQRTRRLKQAALARGRPPSNAAIAATTATARDAALSTSLFAAPDATRNKGFTMMAKMGFSGGGLGRADAPGRAEPIRVAPKSDRAGIGLDAERKRKAQDAGHAPPEKVARIDPLEYRDRVARERAHERRAKQLHAAQRLAQDMHEAGAEQAGRVAEQDGEGRAVNVLWRGLVKARRETERQKALKRQLEESLSAMHDGNGLDDDDRVALGKDVTPLLPVGEDGDEEEDAELKAFEELDIEEQLTRVLMHLRQAHRYCFWCKAEFPDAEMDGCPGVTEEDHD